MKQRIKKLLKGNGGFTLVELIVVIAVLGILVAMIAPRITGVDKTANKNVVASNAQKVEQTIFSAIETHGSMSGSDGLTNLMNYDGTNYSVPTNDLHKDFITNNRLVKHTLNDDEVAEIVKMGIKNLYNTNYTYSPSHPRYEKISLVDANNQPLTIYHKSPHI